MRIHSLIAVCALAMGLASPAMAQQSVHRYVVFFKYGDNAVKAMTETRKIALFRERRYLRASAANSKPSISFRRANSTEWQSTNFWTM